MEEQTSFPFGIPPKRYPTPSMIATLKRHKKYRKGMEYDEAAGILQNYAEGLEPQGPINVAFAMAKYKKEKAEIEERIRLKNKLPIANNR